MTVSQYHNATTFYAFYADIVTHYYSDASCTQPKYSELKQCVSDFKLSCSYSYDKSICLGKVESVSIKIMNSQDENMQAIVDACGSKLTHGFVDVS